MEPCTDRSRNNSTITSLFNNNTVDGTYSAYSDGSPVAIVLRLNFMETKLLYSNEVGYQEERTDGAGLVY